MLAPSLLHYAFYLLELLLFNVEHKGSIDRVRELHDFVTNDVLRYAGLQPSNNQYVCEVLYCSVELERVRNFESDPGRVFKVGFKFLHFFLLLLAEQGNPGRFLFSCYLFMLGHFYGLQVV